MYICSGIKQSVTVKVTHNFSQHSMCRNEESMSDERSAPLAMPPPHRMKRKEHPRKLLGAPAGEVKCDVPKHHQYVCSAEEKSFFKKCNALVVGQEISASLRNRPQSEPHSFCQSNIQTIAELLDSWNEMDWMSWVGLVSGSNNLCASIPRPENLMWLVWLHNMHYGFAIQGCILLCHWFFVSIDVSFCMALLTTTAIGNFVRTSYMDFPSPVPHPPSLIRNRSSAPAPRHAQRSACEPS